MRYIDNDGEFGRRGRRSGERGRGPLRRPPHGPGFDPRGFGDEDPEREGRPGRGGHPHEGHGPFEGRGPFDGPGPRGGRGPREGRPGRDGGPGRGRGRGRALRGDVRTAVLMVIAEQPMHGYQIMQAMSERTGGAWKPSPGAVYPTIAQLEDEGLVTTESEGGRKLVSLTDEGRTYVEERRERQGDPFTEFGQGPAGSGLHEPIRELHGAVRQVAASGNTEQIEAAQKVLAQAKRSLYLILAGETPEQ